MNVLSKALLDVGRIFALALRLLAWHWPQLLALYLAGAAGRMLFLWLALWLSKFNSLLGTLFLPLAPLCVLLSLVVMLRVCADSLPAMRGARQEGNIDTRWKVNLKIAVQALIPFVAVYASQKLLTEDSRFFIYTSTADEFRNNELNANYARVSYASGWVLTALVLTALTLRKWISARKLTGRSIAWGLFGGYLEAFWLVALGTALSSQLDNFKEWVTSRALVDQVMQWQSGAREAPTAAALAVSKVLSSVGEMLGSAGNLVILPVAWLAVGALVYGSKLSEHALPSHEQMTERLKRVPNSLQKAATQILEPVLTPLQNTLTAIRKIASAGLLSMVIFCVCFGLAGSLVKVLSAWLLRWLTGPRTAAWQEAYLPYLLLVERGAFFLLTVALVAAAVNHILLADRGVTGEKTEQRAEPDTGLRAGQLSAL